MQRHDARILDTKITCSIDLECRIDLAFMEMNKEIKVLNKLHAHLRVLAVPMAVVPFHIHREAHRLHFNAYLLNIVLPRCVRPSYGLTESLSPNTSC